MVSTSDFEQNQPNGISMGNLKFPLKFGEKTQNVGFELSSHVHNFCLCWSIPVNKYITKKQLIKNLHTLKKQPQAIPYVTSYYKKRWGFCIAYDQLKKIRKDYSNNDLFKVMINSSFNSKGNLNYGEMVIKGKSSQEILISTYICHPSMANNELSGPLVATELAKYFISLKSNSKTLRFIFVPETIGSIVYLNKNLNELKKK